jgi:hypothetical protein
MARPLNVHGGTGRAGSQSLFRRTYDYAPEAAGLAGVPIQVWATKSFTASWVVRPTSDDAPFLAVLKHPPADPQKIVGTITNNLPADLVDVTVFYKGNVYAQGRMDAGVPKRLDFSGSTNRGLREWMSQVFVGFSQDYRNINDLTNWTAGAGMKGLLFHEKADPTVGGNTGLRTLDQGWRLKDRDEVVLLGRVEPRAGDGPAEKVTLDPATPSRLWLGALPGSGQRPKLDGTLTQRTFVRVYIPVQK